MSIAEEMLRGVLPQALDVRFAMSFDAASVRTAHAEVLVIGSGIAGLTAALHASRFAQVILVTKSEVTDTNTWCAQGGIAGAVGEADSVELHLADTLVVGAGLCDPEAVRAIVGEAADALAELEALGVRFDRIADGHIALAREGGHSLPRVLHSGDATGAEVQNRLSAIVRDDPAITLVENALLVDLLTEDGRCTGALIMSRTSGELTCVCADAVVLATGGCGQVFSVTTNPLVATGDGVAAAWRAGAEISDMEFVQFHPTALDSGRVPKFLITEALRGEGAYLLDDAHERFMLGRHPLAELAPRDVVSREMERVMRESGHSNVWLDARHLGAEFLAKRFPTVTEGCREAGYDLSRDLVPVAPAAHYLIGGVRIDIDGRTSLEGLYASGECAASGLHGANRLASNSLLEGLVISRRIVRVLAGTPRAHESAERAERSAFWGSAEASLECASVRARADTASAVDLQHIRAAVQEAMSAYAAVTRSAQSLGRAAAVIGESSWPLATARSADPFAIETQNLMVNAALITAAALLREESRGTHYRSDWPQRDDEHWRVHTLWRRGCPPKPVPVPSDISA